MLLFPIGRVGCQSDLSDRSTPTRLLGAENETPAAVFPPAAGASQNGFTLRPATSYGPMPRGSGAKKSRGPRLV